VSDGGIVDYVFSPALVQSLFDLRCRILDPVILREEIEGCHGDGTAPVAVVLGRYAIQPFTGWDVNELVRLSVARRRRPAVVRW